MKIRKLETLFLSLMVGAVIYTPGVTNATNGARLTLQPPEYVELDMDPDDFQGTEDDDGHADDLMVTFTETGFGNSKNMDITVSAVREISATCVSANGGGIALSSEDTIVIRVPDESSEPSATFASDDDGRLTGTVPLHTSFADSARRSLDEESGEYTYEWERGDVCPKEPDGPGVLVLKDYAITYTDLTVIDHENGGASASIARVEEVPGEPGYRWEELLTVGVTDGNFFGFSCTIESLEAGHCEPF